jgi:hypothetical protein
MFMTIHNNILDAARTAEWYWRAQNPEDAEDKLLITWSIASDERLSNGGLTAEEIHTMVDLVGIEATLTTLDPRLKLLEILWGEATITRGYFLP